jgi:hypothetical protein
MVPTFLDHNNSETDSDIGFYIAITPNTKLLFKEKYMFIPHKKITTSFLSLIFITSINLSHAANTDKKKPYAITIVTKIFQH